MASIAISCVIDEDFKYHRQARSFIASLAALDHARDLKKIVHHTGPLQPEFSAWLSGQGVTTRQVARYGDGPAAYCNKLQQFESLLQTGASHLILCDADIVFLSSPRALVREGHVRARIVDGPNPDAAMLRRLLDAAGFRDEPCSAQPGFQPGARTHRLNCNGGMYVLERKQLSELSPAWRRWSAYCLSRQDILRDKILHADQLGFMLAMLETGLPFAELPCHANFPTHFDPARYADVPETFSSLHYHGNVDGDGRLGCVGIPGIDAAIRKANAALAGTAAASANALLKIA
ncbi:hypothetical protein [Luteimonas aquatica]|uniref:hypothetical protein n=1 Tax=Luteimonas aquatica TaxID=450364 RepID=UPI001F59C832|nr:hypothetical protein [Luteimonas aquatica]